MEKKERNVYKVIFFIYVIVLIKVIIFKYPFAELKQIADTWEKGVILEGWDTANFTLLKTIKMYIRYSYKLNSFENLVGNVAAFIPFGYLLPCLSKAARNVLVLLLNAFFFVLAIELFQLVSAFGVFDVDDILLNCMGALIGYLIYILNKKLLK